MWLFTNKGFFSIVSPKAGDPALPKGYTPATLRDYLLVRARRKGHIEAVFPGTVGKVVDVTTLKGAGWRDYRFRAVVPRAVVADTLVKVASEIAYSNFKDSCYAMHDADYKSMLGSVWNAAYDYQERRKPVSRRYDFVENDEPPFPDVEDLLGYKPNNGGYQSKRKQPRANLKKGK